MGARRRSWFVEKEPVNAGYDGNLHGLPKYESHVIWRTLSAISVFQFLDHWSSDPYRFLELRR